MLSFSRRFAILTLAILSAGSALAQGDQPELLLYCGITMVRPMTEIAQLFEQREGVKIIIAQGGSEDLYQSAKKSGVGDWYLPGEPSYRDKHQSEGLLGDFVTVGYNQMALMVQKGNPKQVKPDPRELLRKDLTAIVGNAESGSVGQEAKAILDALGIYQKVLRAAAFLAPDSRSLMNAMKKQEADVTLVWRATGFFPDNAALLDVIDLDPSLAKPQALLLIQLNSAKHPELAERFMHFTAGDEGQAIFSKHGFLDNQTASDR
ncbi:substrate-binding domain-containing protein [uncultured Thiocystis sp.]|jgi:molybdate transport system substrate-binding protein|uniref:substrate-binding domain-containing protein n=1 Tax=uncultured Thiocystis sp. TaxID=1202134 RepID=UPI0025EA311C|nr:substrate-binding domain-containing protein [uncultured Thiocystis sp.]